MYKTEGLLRKAKLAVRRGNYRQADSLLRRTIILKSHPLIVGKAWFYRASIMAALEEYRKAIDYCEKSLKFNKYYYLAHLLKGTCFRKLGKFNLALSALNDAFTQKEDEPRILLQQSIALAKLGKKEEVKRYFQRILELPFNFFQTLYEDNHEPLEHSAITSGSVTFLGVEHGCALCINNIERLMDQEKFDAVGLELDFIRLLSYYDNHLPKGKQEVNNRSLAKFESIDFEKSDIWADQFHELDLLAWYAYQTFPGQEMMIAAQISENNAIPYFLLDQNIHITHHEVKNLETDLNRVIIKKRDLMMITKLSRIQNQLHGDAKILCVVGRAHLYGLYSLYESLQVLKNQPDAPAMIFWGDELT